jgi:anaphase-promoting complex subunit 6
MDRELASLSRLHFDRREYESASFYADKVLSLTPRDSAEFPEVLYSLANCYFHSKHFPRVTFLLEKHDVLNSSLKFQVLAGQAMLAAKNYAKCLRILQEETKDDDPQWLGVKYMCLGKAHEAKESKQMAAQAYSEALKADPTNIEAFNALIDGSLLSADQELALISSLEISNELVKGFYFSRLKLSSESITENFPSDNIDLLITKATKLLYAHKVEQAYELATRVIRDDPYHLAAVPLHCACMVALGEVGELFNLSHNLVREYGDSAVAWYSAGAYYFLIKKYELARKYFMKSYKLDRSFLPAWVGYGHTFGAQDQSDQAMAAYRSVARLFPGCHLAHLFMGMEYLRTKNLRTALLSFELANEVNNRDPIVWNEIGVVLYKRQEFRQANEVLNKALNLCEGVLSSTTETVLFNLAHSYRKLQ